MFYNETAKKIPFIQDILENFDEIKTEIIDFANTGKAFLPYKKYSYIDPVTNKERKSLFEHDWKVFSVTKFNWDGIDQSAHHSFKNDLYNRFVKIVYRKCKKLRSILKEYDESSIVINGMVSRLSPGTIIHPHRGWNANVLRTHICLVEDLQCYLTVNEQTQTWKEGQVLSFVDYDIHSVEHRGTKDRIVLSLDINFDYVRKYDTFFDR